jgi:hypothetical protein
MHVRDEIEECFEIAEAAEKALSKIEAEHGRTIESISTRVRIEKIRERIQRLASTQMLLDD